MKRRDFLYKFPLVASTPFFIGGIPMSAWSAPFESLDTQNSDKVLIIIQLHGGNDGLNMFIPINQYSQYYNLRPNIAIPDFGSRKYIKLDSTLADNKQIGLHPDMVALKELYDRGNVLLVQGVSYQNNNGSHFRGRDIWFMGGGYNDYAGSGWMGRLLDNIYPGYPDGPPQAYPNATMPDPLGLEIGEGVSLAFQRDNGIPAGLAVESPQAFYDLINSVGGKVPKVDKIKPSYHKDELLYIMGMEDQSKDYARRLKEVFEAGGTTSTIYPSTYPLNAPAGSLSNRLAGQLQLVARLLRGGIKTRFFLVRIGGFDTHASQVETYNTTLGSHAALAYHISTALKAFMDDLKLSSIDNKVMAMTVSEFGRRVRSNSGYGTDHGTAGTSIVVGANVNPGVLGNNPDLANIPNDNLPMNYDYRQLLATLIEDWMGGNSTVLQASGFAPYTPQKLDLIRTGNSITNIDEFLNTRFRLDNCFPNPANEQTVFSFFINSDEHVKLGIFDLNGKLVQEVINELLTAGKHQIQADISRLKVGTYVYKWEAGDFSDTKKLIIYR
ncbi:MAG: DUF1501 domain-containing protein [Cytophagales bacterium]|nr:MAG: DUF1501 domain-containing protein [Cytophagales bacterium]